MAEPSLGRTIGFGTALSLLVGGVVGSGIFMRPAQIAALLGSPWLMVLAWILGGVVTLLVTMILAELAALLPEEGGTYTMMRHMYGDFWAYIYGWACFVVINCAGTAGIAFIFSEYLTAFIALPRLDPAAERAFSIHIPLLGTVFPLENLGVKTATVIILMILSWVNYRSTKAGGMLQVVSTVGKVLAIALLTIGLLFSGQGNWSHFAEGSASIRPEGVALWLAMAAAINGCFQAYDGTSVLLNITGEIKDPQKTLPRVLIGGIALCIFIYLLVNAGLIYMLETEQMAGSSLVAADAATKAFGPAGSLMVSALICLSVFGTTNANVMTPPRLTFSMARNRHMFPFAGKVHPRFNTPGNAILLHLVLMILLVFSGSFYMLTDMYIFIVWLFNLFFIGGLFVLRRKMPDAHRPYRVWGYPWMPALMFVGNLVYLSLLVYGDADAYLRGETEVIHSFTGLAITATGIPLYFFFRRR